MTESASISSERPSIGDEDDDNKHGSPVREVACLIS